MTPEIPIFDWLTGGAIFLGSVIALSAAVLEKRAPLRCVFWVATAIVLSLAGTEEISDLIGLSVPRWADADEAKITLSIATPFALVFFAALYRMRGPALGLLFVGLLLHVTHLAVLNSDAPSYPAFLAHHWQYVREVSEMATIQIYLAMMVVVVVAVARGGLGNRDSRQNESWRETLFAMSRYVGTWPLVHAVGDFRFASWKLAHPHGKFGDFYAREITRKIESGRPHRTLGDKNWDANSAFDNETSEDETKLNRRGQRAFMRLRAEGILPHHRCIDVGCGSLRVGQHLIRYLEPDHYLGLDVVDTFYRAGLKRIPETELKEKRPRFALISEAIENGLGDFNADFIIATSVLQHVPPGELDEFGDTLRRFCNGNTTMLVTFHRSPQIVRTALMSWAYDDTTVRHALCSDHQWSWKCHDFGHPRHAGKDDWTLTLGIARNLNQIS